MKYFEVNFIAQPCNETITDVLAALTAEIGFESFVPDEKGMQAYIQQSLFNEEALKEVIRNFPMEDVSLSYTITEPEDKDWNEEWEKNYFKPIKINNDCIIRASFHEDEPGYKYNIIIDPKMAFGTGNHATTFLMISEMLKLDLEGKELLDMGCGTAVLAILAKMKNASRVVAIDIDEWAYNNALENIKLNHTEEIQTALGGAEKIDEFGKFDIIFANINRNILLNDMHVYKAHLKDGGTLFMSGFYTEDIPAISEECNKNGLNLVSYSEKDNWVAVKAQ